MKTKFAKVVEVLVVSRGSVRYVENDFCCKLGLIKIVSDFLYSFIQESCLCINALMRQKWVYDFCM